MAAEAIEVAEAQAEDVALVENVAAEATAQKKASTTLSAADIVRLTDLALQSPCQVDAMKQWNEENTEKRVSAAVVSKYVNHKKDTGAYYVAEKRGPKALLTDDEMARLLSLTQRTRSLGWPITASRFASLARGITLKTRGTLSNVPGVAQFSDSWAKKHLRKEGFRVRAATTSRTVTARQVVEEGGRWFRELEELRGSDVRVIFNVAPPHPASASVPYRLPTVAPQADMAGPSGPATKIK